MVSLTELAERVEKAEGSDRELDAEITVACDIRPKWLADQEGEMWVNHKSPIGPEILWRDAWMKRGQGNPSAYYQVSGAPGAPAYPAFTSSLDAALALVPEGWIWSIDSSDACAYAVVSTLEGRFLSSGNEERHARCKTPALALCAAALRARAATPA